MSKRNKDVPGNAMASAAQVNGLILRMGQSMLELDRLLERYDDEDVFISGFSVRPPGTSGNDWFLVVRAETPEGKKVAFHNAPTFAELVKGLVDRLSNRSLKWKADQYG